MHRKGFIEMLERYASSYPGEEEVSSRFIEFVRRHEDCFERSLAAGHVTGSAWILNADSSKTLLTHHRKLGKWLQTGGHADGDPDVLRVALREAEEETGLPALRAATPEIFDLDIHLIPARKSEAAHFHYDARFLLRHEGPEAFVVSDESHDLAWVPLSQLETYTTEPSMLRMRDKTARLLT